MVVKKLISRFIQIFTNVVVVVCVHAWVFFHRKLSQLQKNRICIHYVVLEMSSLEYDFFSQEIITVAKEQNMYSLCSSRNE